MFLQIKHVLHRPSNNIPFWLDGDHPVGDYIDDLVGFFLYPGYLVNATELFGNRTVRYRFLDENTMTWTHTWHSEHYYDLYKNTNVKWIVNNKKYWDDNGIMYTEQISNIPYKHTTNRRVYMGCDYVFSNK